LSALGLALVAAILFGAATPASKLLLETLAPFQLAGLLYLGAMLGMAPLVAREARGKSAGPLDSANRRRLAAAVVFGGLVGPALLLIGLRSSPAGSIALVLNLEGVATAILGVLFFREHLGWIGWLGVAGALAAAALVAGGEDWPGLVGTLFAAAACVCWAIDNHATALIDGLSPERCTLVKGLVAGTCQLAIGAVVSPWTAPPGIVLAALAVGALSYGVSIALYVRAAQQVGATRAQAVFASAPFIGAALSPLVLDERPTALHGVAALLLIPSVGALFWSRHSHSHSHSAMRHTHAHRHDDLHHDHFHDPASPPSADAEHSHEHVHEPVTHSHPHWPDLHHRHDHSR
jgi:drug/metabolite transporter (DMT)-like permease